MPYSGSHWFSPSEHDYMCNKLKALQNRRLDSRKLVEVRAVLHLCVSLLLLHSLHAVIGLLMCVCVVGAFLVPVRARAWMRCVCVCASMRLRL